MFLKYSKATVDNINISICNEVDTSYYQLVMPSYMSNNKRSITVTFMVDTRNSHTQELEIL